MITIFRCPNRRLYGQKRYLRLDDLQAMIRSGEVIRVTDKPTSVDLTRDILFDILKRQQLAEPTLTLEQIAELIRA